MTEGEWQSTVDAAAMLRAVQFRATERKRRLFACACARLVWDLLPAPVLRAAVEDGERAADGLIPDSERQAHIDRLYAPWARGGTGWFDGRPTEQVPAAERSAFFAAKMAVAPGLMLARQPGGIGWEETACVTGTWQPGLLRDIFGHDPAGLPTFDPAWRTPDVVTLAGHIYHDRAFGELPELGAVLERAGCNEAAVLAHCRGRDRTSGAAGSWTWCSARNSRRTCCLHRTGPAASHCEL
jgi:hypothetical protein